MVHKGANHPGSNPEKEERDRVRNKIQKANGDSYVEEKKAQTFG